MSLCGCKFFFPCVSIMWQSTQKLFLINLYVHMSGKQNRGLLSNIDLNIYVSAHCTALVFPEDLGYCQPTLYFRARSDQLYCTGLLCTNIFSVCSLCFTAAPGTWTPAPGLINMNLQSMEQMKEIYDLKECEKALRPKIRYHITSILHIWTVLSVLCRWLKTLKLWAGCLLNSKVGMCPVLARYVQTKALHCRG